MHRLYFFYVVVKSKRSGFHPTRKHVGFRRIFITTEKETIRCSDSLAGIEQMHSSIPCFYRCHKAYLINMDHIAEVRDTFILHDGTRIPLRIREKKSEILSGINDRRESFPSVIFHFTVSRCVFIRLSVPFPICIFVCI